MAPAAILDFVWVILDHPRSVIVGPSLVFKFRLDRFHSFRNIAVVKFWRFGFNFPLHVVISAAYVQIQR